MVYLLYGLEKYLIDKEITKIKDNNNISDVDISYFDLDDDKINDIIEDAETFPMFSDKKMIVALNASLFTSKSSSDDNDYSKLEEYLNNINPYTILVFTLNEDKLDERKKITKLIKKNGSVKELSINDINAYVKDMFGEYKISKENIKLFVDRVGNDLNALNNEVMKLKLYKEDNLDITKEDILNLTSENTESDLFSLIDEIIAKDVNNALITYNKLLKLNEDPINIIINLANKIRVIYQTKELYGKGYNDTDIAQILEVKPGYLYYMKDSLRKYNSKTLLELLDVLIDLDYKIKKNLIDKNNALELFILSMN